MNPRRTSAFTAPWRDELRATARLAAPIALANLLQMAVAAVDVAFVGRLGEEALAASALGVAIFMLTMFGLSSLASAVAPLIAAERGRRAHAVREIRRSVRMALWLGAGTSLLGMAICAGGEAFMRWTGQDPALSARAAGFLRVLSFAMVPMIIGQVLRTFVSAMGRPGFATVITGLAIGVNAFGNWVFVFGHLGVPAMGLEGSAMSTILTAIVTVLAYAAGIARDRNLRRYRIWGRWWRPEWTRLREILKIGLPITATILAEGGLFSSAAFLMGQFGAAVLAAHTLALNVAAAFFQVPFGIGQAATIRIGYHFGAGDRDGIARAGGVALVVTLGFQLLSAALMIAAPALLLSIYLDTGEASNAELVRIASGLLGVAAVFQLADGLQAVAAGMLRGLQDTRVPMAIAIGGYWAIGFVIAVGLGFHTRLAGLGVWWGLAAGLFVVAALLLWRWKRRDRLLPAPARRIALADRAGAA